MESLKKASETAIYDVLIHVGGGEDEEEAQNNWTEACNKLKASFVSFPNNNKKGGSSCSVAEGTPHDMESRAALTLFYKFRQTVDVASSSSSLQRKGRAAIAATATATTNYLLKVVSKHGLERTFSTPFDFASALCPLIEEQCSAKGICCYNVQSSSSGILCIVTPRRSEALRKAGRLPCPRCIQWCKGEKGLWGHQQQKHGTEYSVATAAAARECNVLAIVPYVPASQQQQHLLAFAELPTSSSPKSIATIDVKSDDPLDYIKEGNMKAVMRFVKNGYEPSTALDKKGASPLLWAAGEGHLDLVKYLIGDCQCCPNQAQGGKRGFLGRTSLHWAARNGHLPVVQYLVDECSVSMEVGTSDGTTAFAWASWQGHLDVMKFLVERGANIHVTNSFGCNAVLWACQGKGDADTMDWLREIGSDIALVNDNGHGVLHKAAQRGHKEIIEWMIDSTLGLLNTIVDRNVESVNRLLNQIGPDKDGCVPSDLAGMNAGMEGHEDLALFLAAQEVLVLKSAVVALEDNTAGNTSLPLWLSLKDEPSYACDCEHTFEPWSGVRRMKGALSRVFRVSAG